MEWRWREINYMYISFQATFRQLYWVYLTLFLFFRAFYAAPITVECVWVLIVLAALLSAPLRTCKQLRMVLAAIFRHAVHAMLRWLIYFLWYSHEKSPFIFHLTLVRTFRFLSSARPPVFHSVPFAETMSAKTVVYTTGLHYNAMQRAHTGTPSETLRFPSGSFHWPIVQFNLFGSIAECQLVTQYHTYTITPSAITHLLVLAVQRRLSLSGYLARAIHIWEVVHSIIHILLYEANIVCYTFIEHASDKSTEICFPFCSNKLVLSRVPGKGGRGRKGATIAVPIYICHHFSTIHL